MEAAYGKYGYYLLSLLQFMYPFLGELCKLLHTLHISLLFQYYHKVLVCYT